MHKLFKNNKNTKTLYRNKIKKNIFRKYMAISINKITKII